MRMNREKPNENILLPFEQDYAFFIRRGDVRCEQGDYLEALVLYRKAINLDVKKEEAWLKLAKAYALLECFSLANDILLKMMVYCPTLPDLYYYEMGCNYVGLLSFERALACFSQFIAHTRGKEIPQRDEVMNLLDALEDEVVSEETLTEDALENGVKMLVTYSQRLIDEEKYDQSLQFLEQAHTLMPENMNTLHALAWGYYSVNNLEKAQEVCEKIFLLDPFDIDGHCIKAMIAKAENDQLSYERSLDLLRNCFLQEEGDAYRVGVTLLEVHEYESAQFHLQDALLSDPYHIAIIHANAVCAYYLKDYVLAERLWQMIKQLIPEDFVAQYYSTLCRDKKLIDPELELPSEFAFPKIEVKKKLGRIQQLLESENPQRINTDLLDIRWMLFNEDGVKPEHLNLLCQLFFNEAESILREYLLLYCPTPELQKATTDCLKRVNAQPPYFAVSENEIVDIYYDDKTPGNRERRFVEQIDAYVARLNERTPKQKQIKSYARKAMKIFSQQVDVFWLNFRVEDFACIFLYLIGKKYARRDSIRTVAKRYGADIDSSDFKMCLKFLKEYLNHIQ